MIRKIICMLTLAAAFVGCTKDEWPDQPDWSRIPDPSIPVDDGFMKPAACSNTVVAHRGGAAECGAPDNSMAALEYAMSLGCYGMECDIYWTKDNDIIVAHANGDCKVNNLQPWTATVAELRAAGRLSNGEELPTLEEFIRRVMVEGNCTRLVLDVKRVDKPYAQPEYVINAARRACEIVTEMKAKHFVELICTGFNLDAMKAAQAGANNFFGGIYGNNGGAASVVNDCRTTASAYVGCPIGKSVGMLAGRPNKKGFTVSNCRIAGTVTNKQGAAVVITADNLEDWMFAGYGTSVAVTLKNNGYNDGK